MRRLLRETYRLNKTELIDKSTCGKVFLNVLFSLSQPAYSAFERLNFRGLENDMKQLLRRIENKIEIS